MAVGEGTPYFSQSLPAGIMVTQYSMSPASRPAVFGAVEHRAFTLEELRLRGLLPASHSGHEPLGGGLRRGTDLFWTEERCICVASFKAKADEGLRQPAGSRVLTEAPPPSDLSLTGPALPQLCC